MDFKVPYNRNEYIDFFRSHFLPEDFRDHSEDIAVGFKSNLITKAVKIGEVPSLELFICEVSHPSENDPRVSLSRDAFRLLAQYGAKRALIIFNSDNSQNFRLSLVTIDLKWEEGKRVQKEYSNPRRYSFFLGPETRTHTPEEYLIKQGRVKDFDDLKGRFSIEVVNKEFYTQIAVLFTQLAGGKREIGRKSIDAGRGLLNLPSTVDDTLDKEFTVRLIGRLVFCWFLKKKRSDKNISLLPEELLSAKAVSENKGYYHGILEPLFFEVLNTPSDNRTKKYQGSPWSQIPFLNGGLFTPHLHDYYEPGPLGISKHINTLKVPDHWIKELFEVFETYNFTIDENTSVDVELSIEPEMLGRIFENLLAEINPETGETARKATGSYYTPRPIVEYMVDESLKQYLLTKTKLDEDKITRLLTYEDVEIKLTGSEKESVLNALDSIKIIDPACGSGAFPMGILQKMLLILQKVDPESEWWLDTKLSQIESKLLKKELGKKLKDENVNYVHKLGIIQSSIYGVDIQPIAVEISKLRFFLSLIVDETVNDAKENRGIEPLPNLEFKFVCANSLIGLPKKEPQQTLFEATDDIKALRDLRDDYLRSYGEEKKKIEKKFQEVQSRMFKHSIGWGGRDSQTLKLAQWDPFSEEPCSWFDPDWMFGMKEGFDIAIANPPYIFARNSAQKGLSKEDKLYFYDNYKLAEYQVNLYPLFIERATQVLCKDGRLTFITPNNWLTINTNRSLRRFVLEKSDIIIVNFYAHVFESAAVDSAVVIFTNSQSRPVVHLYEYTDTLHFIKKVEAEYFLKQRDYVINVEAFKSGGVAGLLSKIEQCSVVLDELTEVKAGLVAYEVGKGNPPQTKAMKDKRVYHATKKLGSDYYKYLDGKDVCRYRLGWSGGYLKYGDNLAAPRIDFALYSTERIIVRQIPAKPPYCIHACMVNETYLNDRNSMNVINMKDSPELLLGIINSRMISFWFIHKFGKLQRGTFPQFKINELAVFPIVQDRTPHKNEIVRLVKKIMDVKISDPDADTRKWDTQIDQMVYELYGLTKKEIEIVEESSGGK